jgi:hypothetical protein
MVDMQADSKNNRYKRAKQLQKRQRDALLLMPLTTTIRNTLLQQSKHKYNAGQQQSSNRAITCRTQLGSMYCPTALQHTVKSCAAIPQYDRSTNTASPSTGRSQGAERSSTKQTADTQHAHAVARPTYHLVEPHHRLCNRYPCRGKVRLQHSGSIGRQPHRKSDRHPNWEHQNRQIV